MKPALLYLRKYIEQNYNGDRYQNIDKKNQKQNKASKNLEESIFKQKKKYEWQNQNKKEFYFKVPKSFNASKIQKKMNLQDQKTEKSQNTTQSLSIEPNNIVKVNKLNHQKYISKKSKDNIPLKVQTIRQDKIQKTFQIVNAEQKQVKFVISPPKKIQKICSQSQQSFSQFQQQNNSLKKQIEPNQLTQLRSQVAKNSNYHQKINQKQKNRLLVPRQNDSKQKINDHTKVTCKSMNKIGYQNLSEYLQQMKNYQKINKNQIKEACYYPLECMKPSAPLSQSYERDSKIIKNYNQRRMEQFSKLIQVHENFTSKIIQNQLKNTSSLNVLNRKKSNFSKNNKKTQNNLDQKGKKFLFQYEKILICNCSNKNFFTYQLSKDADYNQFLKLTTSLLQSKPSKQNNYLIGNQETAEFNGLYFCCLINSNENQKQTFFWIGWPIQYYRKDLIISAIDNFLLQINAYQIIESEKIWIVDFHGRNSFITKRMLTKCQQIKPQKKFSFPKNQKSRISKRMSLSQQLAEFELSESLLNLMTNSSNFKESDFVRKQRNNISTKGAFHMVYQSKETLK